MRLLNSTTLKLTDFMGSTPPYAILSHTWGEDEISFQEMKAPNPDQKSGYNKIERCCEMAAQDGFEFVWIDTCCIDKTSSSELSEAINSMYSWYQRADVCYVYIADLALEDFVHESSHIWPAFSSSKWFTRGWTLQELIAPANVVFFDRDWNEIGTKITLQTIISSITHIDVNVLSNGDLDLNAFSVAQKMSWAAKRETTRPEDMAYCLLGIFDVHMPMLYGEGQRAFIRLQEGIMQVSNDNTLFAWENETKLLLAEKLSSEYTRLGLLAASPRDFSNCGTIIQSPNLIKSKFTSTNRGINLTLPLKLLLPDIYLAVLSCERTTNPGCVIGIHLQKAPRENDLFVRMWSIPPMLITISEVVGLERQHIFVAHDRRLRYTIEPCTHVLLKIPDALDGVVWVGESCLPSALSTHSSSSKELLFHFASPDNSMGFIGAIEIRSVGGGRIVVILRSARTMLLVTLERLLPYDTVEDVFNQYTDLKRRWISRSARKFHNPLGNGAEYLKIAVRRQIVSGKRTHMLDVSYDGK